MVHKHTWLAVMAVTVAVLTASSAPAASAADEAPLVVMDLGTEGAPFDFGLWLADALGSGEVTVRWPDYDEAGKVEGPAACIVTWSDPERGSDWRRRMRAHLRAGGGVVYVVDAGRKHLRAARNLWSYLGVDLEAADGETGFAGWGRHPITKGLPSIGAADPRTYISGPGAVTLIRFGSRALAAAFDWGDQGRGVIIDHAVMTGQLNSSTPRTALREFLVRSVLWAAGSYQPPSSSQRPKPGVGSGTGTTGQTPAETGEGGEGLQWPRPEPVGPMSGDSALIDIVARDESWERITTVVTDAAKSAGLRTDAMTQDKPAGDSRLSDRALRDVDLLIIGAAREDFDYAQARAVRDFFDRGGRLLLLPRDEPKPHPCMIAFNRILAELELAASLGRPRGQVVFQKHEITRGLYKRTSFSPEQMLALMGAQVWGWQTDPLVTVADRVAAAAWETEHSRLVIMDAGLLLPSNQREPDLFITLLNNAVEWLKGG